MARIPEYEPPDRQITASDKGANAFEQAGRRIGPAYNEAATLQRQAGEAQAATIRQRRWPFDMLELERSLEDTSKSTGSSKSGFGIKLEGGVNNLEHEGEGTSSSRSRLGNDVGATSLAAGALGKLAPRLGSTGKYHNSLIDPHTGIDLNLLRPKQQETKQLVNGELVPSSKAATFGGKTDINGEKAADKWSQIDWTKVDPSDPKNAKLISDYTRGGANPYGGINDREVETGGDPQWSTRSDPNSVDNRYSPSPPADVFPATTSARGSSTPSDFWSDITNGLGGVLGAATSGDWPGNKDYGGGVDTNDYTGLSGEGAQ